MNDLSILLFILWQQDEPTYGCSSMNDTLNISPPPPPGKIQRDAVPRYMVTGTTTIRNKPAPNNSSLVSSIINHRTPSLRPPRAHTYIHTCMHTNTHNISCFKLLWVGLFAACALPSFIIYPRHGEPQGERKFPGLYLVIRTHTHIHRHR